MRVRRFGSLTGVCLALVTSTSCTTSGTERAPVGPPPEMCTPHAWSCSGNQSRVCRDDGAGWEPVALCDLGAGELCEPRSGRCVNPCREAAEASSYMGCEYWPVTTQNSQVAPEIEFGIAVANTYGMDAHVTIERAGETIATRTVATGGVEVVPLPWVMELKGESVEAYSSRLVRGGAYRLRSDVPVVVYQFNPLHYRIEQDCENEVRLEEPLDDSQCFSWSNDASLLLPTHALSGSYSVLTWPTEVNRAAAPGFASSYGGSPAFFAVVGVEEEPTTVTIRFRGHVEASDDDGASVRAFAPGETGTFTLGQGDVLELMSELPAVCLDGSYTDHLPEYDLTYCKLPREYDLTGTEISATGRVAVLAGHNCAFVPIHRWSCDHLEEQLFPLESWGKDVVVSVTRPLREEPNVVRVVSSRDGNIVTFDPPAVHEPVTLARGELVEFETVSHVKITGTEALLVAQFMVGQSYAGLGTAPRDQPGGDPSMAYAIPTEQQRVDYTFLTPDTYDESVVNVTAASGSEVLLDGTPIGEWTEVATTGLAVARTNVPSGAHRIRSALPFGLVVYGFGSYTSYMYPGGLDLRRITAPF